ncbi:hypothetical protein C2S52_019319 [Perilla frutescens var. hirtella]|nr:hypothetical protein C2S52_019319 [Perilla frutescens var. hirtella]
MSKAVSAEVGAADSDLGIESKRQVVKKSLSKIENAVKGLDEILAVEYPKLKSETGELKRIGKYLEELKVSISEVSHEKQPPHEGDRRESLDQQEWAALKEDDETLAKNAKKDLDENQLKCLLCLVEFPEKMAIKKRPLIYWWIGEGLISREESEESKESSTAEEVGREESKESSTAEEVGNGEQVFQKLLQNYCIRPSNSSSFMVYPWVRRPEARAVLWPNEPSNGNKRVFLKAGNKYDVHERETTVVNVDNQYLGTKPEWQNSEVLQLGLWRNSKVLQLGRWQDSATHHIEVDDYKTFLDGLDSQEKLKYLSLRGISRIETLPRSIKKLTALQILDLRACHNLEKLPSGISELKSLTHLDVSECYLLDSMPKGIEGLSLLQVLKGFVVSNPSRNSCKIADLERLTHLRKLTVRLGNANHQLPNLGRFSALRIFTISWSFTVPKDADSSFLHSLDLVLPKKLIKLDLRSVPFKKVPEWLQPTKLPYKLEKLYIKGGKLEDLNHSQYGNIKFLRLSYLKQLKTHQWESHGVSVNTFK